jgi:hypothetical protein
LRSSFVITIQRALQDYASARLGLRPGSKLRR